MIIIIIYVIIGARGLSPLQPIASITDLRLFDAQNELLVNRFLLLANKWVLFKLLNVIFYIWFMD